MQDKLLRSKKQPIPRSVSSDRSGSCIGAPDEGKQYGHHLPSPSPTTQTIRHGPLTGHPLRPEPRPDRYLQLSQVADAVNATMFAQAHGYALNALLSVSWRYAAGFDEHSAAATQGRLFHAFNKWLLRRNVVLRGAWVRERVSGKGLHSHLLLNLPAHLKEDAELFLTKAGSFQNEGFNRGVDIQTRKGTPNQISGALRYLLKGLDHRDFIHTAGGTTNLGDLLGVQHRGDQGIISIKRQGCTQNISRKARREAGWREVKNPFALSCILNNN